MNRDRETIARIVREACVRWAGVAVSTKTIMDDAVDAILALPPAGGVEEAIRIVREHQHYRFGLVDRNGKWVTSEIVRVSGQGAGKDFNSALERWLPALSPRSPDTQGEES